MKNQYSEIVFPKTRIATLDVGELGKKKHHIAGLIEIDVTDALRLIREYRVRTDSPLSFTAWLVKTISLTLEEHAQAHAFLRGNRKVLIFDDIDITITVEREVEGALVPLPYVIRETNKKNLSEISEEIENAKNKSILDNEVVLGKSKNSFLENLYYLLPGFIRRMIWKYFLLQPLTAKKNMGSVVLTSVGMMGAINGWFIPTSIQPLAFGIGSITKKPGVVKNKIEIREFLHMTILFDHDVVDGAPMARFTSKLVKNIESGFGLT